MRRENLNKYDLLDGITSQDVSKEFKSIIENSGINIDYYSYDSDGVGYFPPISIYCFVETENNPVYDVLKPDIELTAVFSSLSFSDNSVVPNKNDKVMYMNIPFYVRELFYYNKNKFIVNDLANSMSVQMVLISKSNITRSKQTHL
jgi:hypothetical protein